MIIWYLFAAKEATAKAKKEGVAKALNKKTKSWLFVNV